MASGGAVAKTMEANNTCAVCQEQLSHTKTMICCHHFCGMCTRKISRVEQNGEKGIICPLCRTFTTEEQIKVNIVLDEIIHASSQGKVMKGFTTAKTCNQCERPLVTSLCVNCNFELCDLCKITHRRIPNFDTHVITAIGDLSTHHYITVNKYCEIHPEKPINHNCHPCDVAICIKCNFQTHDTHRTESIDAAINRLLPALRSVLSGLEQKIQTRAEKRVALDQLLNVMKLSCSKVSQDILTEKQQKIKSIESDYEILIGNIEANQQAMEKQIGMMIEDLDNSISSIKSMVQWGETLSLTRGPAVLVELQGDVIKRAEQLADHNIDLVSTEQLLKENQAELQFEKSVITNDNLVGIIHICDDTMAKSNMENTDLNSQVRESTMSTSAVSVNPLTLSLQQDSSAKSEKSPLNMQQIECTSLKSENETLMYDENYYGLDQKYGTENRYKQLQHDYEREIKARKRLESQILESHGNPSPLSQYPGSFRKTSKSLMNIKALLPVKEHNFNIKNDSKRFCYFNNMFLFTHPCNISCYTTTGQFVKLIHLEKYKIENPRSIHPLTGDTVLVAAESGLYMVGTGEGDGVGYCVNKGNFIDVHVCEGVVAVLVQHSVLSRGKVYLYDTSDLSTVKSTIKLKHNIDVNNVNTMLIRNDVIYICSTNQARITTYHVKIGNMISKYGQCGWSAPGELSIPRLSVCDAEGSLLVSDSHNFRLQTLSAGGKWSVLPVQKSVTSPQDAIIIDDSIYILDKCNTIHAFQITFN